MRGLFHARLRSNLHGISFAPGGPVCYPLTCPTRTVGPIFEHVRSEESAWVKEGPEGSGPSCFFCRYADEVVMQSPDGI